MQRVELQSRGTESGYRVEVQSRGTESGYRVELQSRCIESGYGVDEQYTLAGVRGVEVGGVGLGGVEGVGPEGVGLEGVGLGAVEAVGVEAVRVGGIRVGEALPLYHRFQLQLERFGGLFLDLFDALNPPVASTCSSDYRLLRYRQNRARVKNSGSIDSSSTTTTFN